MCPGESTGLAGHEKQQAQSTGAGAGSVAGHGAEHSSTETSGPAPNSRQATSASPHTTQAQVTLFILSIAGVLAAPGARRTRSARARVGHPGPAVGEGSMRGWRGQEWSTRGRARGRPGQPAVEGRRRCRGPEASVARARGSAGASAGASAEALAGIEVGASARSRMAMGRPARAGCTGCAACSRGGSRRRVTRGARLPT
jgi:hypothetical protein